MNYLQFNSLPVYTKMREVAQSALEQNIGKQSKVNGAFVAYIEEKIKTLFAQPSDFVDNYTTYNAGDER